MKDKPPFERLIEENTGLVRACAARFLGKGVEYEDLVGAGFVGLVRAARGFDPSRGFTFSTYAVPSILGEIRRLFRDGGAVKIGRTAKEKAADLTRTARRLREDLGREPTVGEIARAAGEDPAQVASLLAAMLPPVSLTDPDGAGEWDLPTQDEVAGALDRIDLRAALARLSPEDRALVNCRYFEGMTQTQVGERLKMTQVQVSRREKQVLARLREMMAVRDGP